MLYVAAESPAGLGQRLRAISERDGLPVTVFDTALFFVDGAVNLGDDMAVNGLANTIRVVEADLLIIDTLARCTAGVKENSATEMGEVIARLDWLRATTAVTPLLVAHPGKNPNQGYRGSSAVRGAIDAELKLTRNGKLLTLATEKQKDDAEGPDIALRMRPCGDSVVVVEHIDPENVPPWRPTGIMERASIVLEGEPDGMSQKALRDVLSVKQKHLAVAIQRLMEDEAIKRAGRGNRQRLVSVAPYREADDPKRAHDSIGVGINLLADAFGPGVTSIDP